MFLNLNRRKYMILVGSKYIDFSNLLTREKKRKKNETRNIMNINKYRNYI